MDPAELGGRLLPADIALVVGTRPEAIKLEPVAAALIARGLCPRLVLTGQHADLDPADYGLGHLPVTQLDCPGARDPDAHVAAVQAAMGRSLRDRPAMLVVQGDTSSALGGALAGFDAGIAVAHVEAGLRSHDPAMPWPEESYRVAIDARADLLFAPTALAAANLRAEKVPGAILITGNSGIDAVLKVAAGLPPVRLHDSGDLRLLVTCHRRENWGAGLAGIARALTTLAAEGAVRIEVLMHPNRHVTDAIRRMLGGVRNIVLVAPCSHRELIRRMRDCDVLLSDSGGVQEEAPALGVPLLVLRAKTERPEALTTGNMRLVGTDTEAILDAVNELRDPVARAAMARPALPYGDGRAGPRIAAGIGQFLAADPTSAARTSVNLRLTRG